MDLAAATRLCAGIFLVVSIEAQAPADRALLDAEQAREAGVPVLIATMANGDAHSRILAARAVGRFENPAWRDSVVPLMRSPDPQVRRAAAGALAQMRAAFAWASLLKGERDASIRAAIFEATGRAKPASDDAEPLLAGGLTDADLRARTGAARGLESLFRLNSKPPRQPTSTALAALHWPSRPTARERAKRSVS